MTENINKELETGRSMVEMLGVLAVVGVLSVGSIAGYTYAMNKYYANELLAGASERAVLVTAQIASGRTPNLNEFANHTVPNGTFGEVKTDIEDGFGIMVSGVKEAVCENLIKATEGTDVSIAKDDKTLSDVTCSGDENTFMFVFDYGVGGGAGGDANTCPTGTSTEGAGGYATTLADNSMCYCETAGTVYKEGTCESKGDDNTCSSYADCDKGEYCQFSPPQTNCTSDPTLGVCQSVSDCRLYDLDIGDGKKYTASEYHGSCSPNWWTSKDICASLNMHMVSLSEVGCEDYKEDYCPTDGTVYGALKAKGLKYNFWTTDLVEENNPNSCSVWSVNDDGDDYVYDSYLFNSYHYDLLCVR